MWDSSADRWGYHDCRLMPFPSSSYSSVDAAIAARLNLSSRSLSRSSSPDSDYWGGYASSDTSPNIILPSNDIAEDEEKAEAAYWASYGAVHGSGDSTVPSPRLHKQSVPNLPETHGDRSEFDPFLANLHLQLQSKTGFLSPRYSGSERSRSPQPVDTLPGDDIADITHNKYGFSDTPEIRAPDAGGSPGINVSEVLSDDNMDDGGLKETIRNLYHMWKGDSRTKNEGGFVNVVKDALNYMS
ncbi:hypothetical protein Clacol_003889 [Clathrus columnatus]|uniref:Uncharacterized protein n=1 Tax=Clathrus columnatus TaxID=1419009 RepID=A0AAV5A9R4_9AGAM|nr:hypothetical protein Clacol_003889 [Clathrus columnatus]